jgi:SAM-dependent methyltransferase
MKTVLVPTHCAICETEGNARELYPANFDDEAFNADVFSARRLPDMVHYRIVRCNQCGLVRSDPIIDQETLKNLYLHSSLTYSKDIPNLRRTYGKYLRKMDQYATHKKSFLEIGCGNGFILEEALSQGFTNVFGVEPSQSAVEQAHPLVKEFIYNDIMRPGLLMQTVDAICMFQLFDHIPNPNEFLATCFDTLQPGGLILCFNHNVIAVSARLLGKKSPIIDIEHTFLYEPETIRKLFEKNGFKVMEVGAAWNYVNLLGVVRLFPFPRSMKTKVLSFLERTPQIGQRVMPVPLGNLYIIAQRPAREG